MEPSAQADLCLGSIFSFCWLMLDHMSIHLIDHLVVQFQLQVPCLRSPFLPGVTAGKSELGA